jgi:translation initiation factor 4E
MPAWEDAANKEGGKWAVQLPRDKTKGAIDQMWLYTVCPSLIKHVKDEADHKMLAAIGETFVASGEAEKGATTGNDAQVVTGVIVSARPNL